MPGRSFILFYLLAFVSLVTLTQAADSGNGGRRARNRRNKKNLAAKADTHDSASVNDILISPGAVDFIFIPPAYIQLNPTNFERFNQNTYDSLLIDSSARNLLNSPDFSIPNHPKFGLMPLVYLGQQRFYLFKLFVKKFNYKKVNASILSKLLVETRNKREYFVALLQAQHQLILNSFRSFWDLMLQIEADESIEALNGNGDGNGNGEDEDEDEDEIRKQRYRFTNLHQSFYWAYEHFTPLLDESNQPLSKYASFCIFNLLLDNYWDVFPESLLEQVLALPGIELNVSMKGSCVALFTLGIPQLPKYYPELILSDPRLEINCIVPATIRKHGHIICHVPPLPLFWHALIYQNSRALAILWANKNLHVLPLIPSFFQLLRLAFLFFFFSLWDGKSCKVERRLA